MLVEGRNKPTDHSSGLGAAVQVGGVIPAPDL